MFFVNGVRVLDASKPTYTDLASENAALHTEIHDLYKQISELRAELAEFRAERAARIANIDPAPGSAADAAAL